MYLVIEENPNCPPDERVFSESGKPKRVEKLNIETPDGRREWCEVVSVDDSGQFRPAQAVQVEDSGAGNAWLIYGGPWGLRFRRDHPKDSWALSKASQWGIPFLVLDHSGEDIQFV